MFDWVSPARGDVSGRASSPAAVRVAARDEARSDARACRVRLRRGCGQRRKARKATCAPGGGSATWRLLGLTLALVAAGAGVAGAQASDTEAPPLPDAVLFSTAGGHRDAEPLDSVLHGALQDLKVVTVVGRPGMDLRAVQLAIDCVNETPRCLRRVARESGATVLVAPSLQHTTTELVVSILRFDATGGEMKRVVRRQAGTRLRPETLDAVPTMLGALFGVAPPPERGRSEAPVVHDRHDTRAHAPVDDPDNGGLPVGPWVVAGAGALVMAGGLVVGMLGEQTNDEYNSASVTDLDDARRLNDLRDRAETEMRVANVMLGIGGAAIAAGAIWLAVALGNRSTADADLAVLPRLGPGELGLGLSYRGGPL